MTNYTEQIQEIREKALQMLDIADCESTFEGITTIEHLCATLEDLEVTFKYRDKNFKLIQVNPNRTLYAYQPEAKVIFYLSAESLNTESLCTIADALANNLYDFERFSYDDAVVFTSLYLDKQILDFKNFKDFNID